MLRPDNFDMLVSYGDAVKALGDGRVGGYIVRFTTHEDPDLEGEFFNKMTDFGDAAAAPVYYQHGLDVKLGKRKIGKAQHRPDEFGIWAEAQLDLRDEYERFIYALAEKGKLGWSSGTASHLVDRESSGKATWIKSWPLGLDDTLTPTPAEPRNTAIPLKSWQPEEMRYTLAERLSAVCGELNNLSVDMQAFVKSIDRPLSETKRKELKELLESCSGLDAVRSDLQSVLASAPIQTRLVEAHRVKSQLADLRKRQQFLQKE